jgi:hypothetical protein
MTLDDIQDSVFQGNKGLTSALNLVKSYIEKKKPNHVGVSTLYNQALHKKSQISISFLNQILITQRYRNYIKSAVPELHRIKNTREIVLSVLTTAEKDSNKRILDAREPQTKRNRQYEKNEVMKFFNTNTQSLVALFELYNLMHDIKDDINRKTDGTN